MRILLTGRNGQVGWELERCLSPLGEVHAKDRHTLDLGDAAALARCVRETRPDVIVNAAAYTAVDRAESESELAHRINADAPGVLAEAARACGALLVHYSTDYVFDGTQARPYTEDDPTAPVNAYGAGKLAGERAIAQSGARHLILRTTWVYGARGGNFLRTILRLALTRDRLRVVDDQIGAPTWSRLIAEATGQIVSGHMRAKEAESGIVHLACSGKTSWYGFAKAIIEETSARLPSVPVLEAIPTAEYPLPAQRPANSVLDCSRLERRFDLRLPDWRYALSLCLQDGLLPTLIEGPAATPGTS